MVQLDPVFGHNQYDFRRRILAAGCIFRRLFLISLWNETNADGPTPPAVR